MNIWITRLGTTPFSEPEINEITAAAKKNPSLHKHDIFRHTEHHIDYVSVCTAADVSNKVYHDSHNQIMTAFSGLMVDKQSGERDLRSIRSISRSGGPLDEMANGIAGQYALVQISEDGFDCITDCLGSYKVFWHQGDDQALYVSNYLPLIQLFKTSRPNLRFFSNWIAASGTYGCETEEMEVFTLPEYGRIRWTPKTGAQHTPRQNLSTLLQPEQDYEELVETTAREWRHSAQNLVNNHEIAVSLSGGYDSRLALNIFWGLDRRKIECFTYPDHINDVRLAKMVAADHGFSHEVLKPSTNLPDLEEVHTFTVQSTYPFLCYSNATALLFNDRILEIFKGHQKVKITGDGGDTHLGIKKFKNATRQIGQNAIHSLTDQLVSKDILKTEAYLEIQSGLRKHYSEKYLEFLPVNEPAEKLPSMHYYLERFGNYQSYKLINVRMNSDLFFPYGNESFLKSVFTSPIRDLIRPNQNSLHHRLSRSFTQNADRPIPFSRNLHWNAGTLDKMNYNLHLNYINPLRTILFGSKEKLSRRIQHDFFTSNRPSYREVLHSYADSELWDYFDQTAITGWLSDDRPISNKKIKVLSRIVPLLKKGL